MKSKKPLIGIAGLAITLTSFSIVLTTSRDLIISNPFLNLSKDYEIILNSNNAPRVLNKEGEATVRTSFGNEINWVYHNVSLLNGSHVVLKRDNIDNSIGNDGYLENVEPITGVISLEINFTGSYVTLYGSNNKTDYHRIKTLSTSGVTTSIKGYQYIRICSGDQNRNDVSLQSVKVRYSCNHDNTVDSSDLITLNNHQTHTSVDDVYPYDLNQSTSFMKINNEEVAFNLSETLVANELDRYNLEIQYMSLGVDNNPLVLSMNDINVNLLSSVNKDTWTSINYDLSTLKDDTTDYITTFNLKLNEGNGYIDDIRIVEKDNYPADGEDVVVPTENTIYLTYPTDDVEVPILYEPVRQYYFDFKESRKDVEDDYILDINEVNTTNHSPRIKDYYSTSIEYEESREVVLNFDISEANQDEFLVHVSTSEDFKDAKIYQTSQSYYSIMNLYRGTRYFWKVTSLDGLNSSEVGTFITEDIARFISAGKVQNIRDIVGGYRTKDGNTIKQGLAYRGQEVNLEDYVDGSNANHYQNLDEETINIFVNDLGIRLDYDLRSESELPPYMYSGLGSMVEYVNNDWAPAYQYISRDKNNVKLIKPIFESFLTADTKPVYLHCWGGADRTGTISFILGGLLGMSFTDLCLEYEYTSFSKNLRQRDTAYKSNQSFPEFIIQLYNNVAGYDLNNNHSIQEICEQILLSAGLTNDQILRLKTIFLED